MKIALCVAYYGRWPVWFPAFLHSCRYNPAVDWYILSDCGTPPNCPANVNIIETTLDEFNSLCSSKLGLPIEVKSSSLYKIVDLKPAFGVIFEDYIKAYDFWGHTDVDLVMGDIKAYISREVLRRFDMITSRHKRVGGHFCLYRNEPRLTQMYRNIPNIDAMMQDETCYGTDEKYLGDYLRAHIASSLISRAMYKLFDVQIKKPRVYWKRELTTGGGIQRALKNAPGKCFLWDRGRTLDSDGNELMYLHFQKLKESMREIDFGYEDDPQRFGITPSGIYLDPVSA